MTDVSVSTVSLVLNDRPGISRQTRTRVLDAAAKLGYGAVSPARNTHTGAIGLMIEQGSIPVLLDIFYGDVIRGFQTEAQRLGYQVLLHMYDQATEGMDAVQSDFATRVRGLVIANDGSITPEMIAQLESVNVPLVLIENHIEGHCLPCILGDNWSAGYAVMRHLLSLGHRDIAILRGPAKYSSLVDRLRGALAAATEAGVRIPQEYLPEPVSEHPQKGYVQTRRLLALDKKPTAILAISDKTAFGAMSATLESGLAIPGDIAIASIDDVADSVYTRPPLTTYHIPKHDMGVLAMQKLHRLITGEPMIPVKSVVYGRLIVRSSCGARH